MSRDLYEILGVSQRATDASIRRAVQTAKDKIAADESLSPLTREARLADVQTAAEVLTSPAKRDQYDDAKRHGVDADTGGVLTMLRAPRTWMILAAVTIIVGGLYWQYARAQTNQRLERERIVAEEQQERRAKEREARRVQETQRLDQELRAQKEADDKLRQETNEIRSAESQKKQYVADDRYTAPAGENPSSYQSRRREYEGQRQYSNEMQQRATEERKQRYEEETNLRRAKADVDRQKRYLEQLEREEEVARASRAARSSPGR